MTATNRKILAFLAVIAVLFGAELVREKVLYLSETRNLQHAYWRIHPGMTREQVLAELGNPTRSSATQREESLEWSAAGYRRSLLRRITSDKGYYVVTVTLGPDGKVIDVTSGSN